VFTRIRELAHLVVSRYLEKTEPGDPKSIGEKFYLLCKKVLSNKKHKATLESVLQTVFTEGLNAYVTNFYSMMVKVLEECNMGRIVLVFTSCMVCCKYLNRFDFDDTYIKRFEECTAHVLITKEEWITKNDFTLVSLYISI